MTRCEQVAANLSAFVDQALDDAGRERVLAHLGRCAACRAETAELRRVRQLLRDAPSTDPALCEASQDLARRLVSIAGAESGQPLWSRPFAPKPNAHGVLPSARRRRHRLAATMMTTTLVLSTAAALGWAAAPQPGVPVDPGPRARSEFASALGELPLSSQAATAIHQADRASGSSAEVQSPALPAQLTLGADEASALLVRAAGQQRPADGVQRVQVRHRAGYWSSDVQVQGESGGATVVLDPDGIKPMSGFLPARRSLGTEVITRYYTLSGGPGPVVAGRNSVVVEARQADWVAARWWLDAQTGLGLWRETYDQGGEVRQSTGYLSLEPAATDKRHRHLPPRLGSPSNAVSLTPPATAQLLGAGWSCPERLAGLELVSMRSAAGTFTTSYSDGVRTLSVLQQSGRLSGPPEGFVWDPALEALANQGLTTMLSWQSADQVFTVATDASPELVRQAAAELPHRVPAGRDPLTRILDGWKELVR